MKANFYAHCAIIFILSACGTYTLISNTAASPKGTVESVHEEVEIEYIPKYQVTDDTQNAGKLPIAEVIIIEEEVEMIFVPAS